MIKKVFAGFALGMVLASTAGAQILSQWNFEGLTVSGTAATTPTATAGSFLSDTGSVSGTASAFHNLATTVWSTPVGNGTSKSLSSTGWSVGDYYQFQTSTIGFSSIYVAWSQQGSGTGPKDFKLAYSLDGTNFTDFVTYTVVTASPSWSSSSYNANVNNVFYQNLSAVSALSNASTVYFRLIDTSTTSIGNGTVGSGGTNRVDQFTISSGFVDITVTPVPEPHEYALAIAGLLGVVVLMRRRKAAQVF